MKAFKQMPSTQIVGVMASGKDEPLEDEGERLANEVATAIAKLGYHLLTGGGGGLMTAVGQAFLDKKREILNQNRPAGTLISVLRAKELPQLKKNGKRSWKANADNALGEIVIRTHLPFSGKKGNDPLSRNHINALTADLVVILPGGAGTLSELQLAWEYGKDIMVYLGKGNVGGKTSRELAKRFRGIEIGRNEQELRSWLKSCKKCTVLCANGRGSNRHWMKAQWQVRQWKGALSLSDSSMNRMGSCRQRVSSECCSTRGGSLLARD